MDADGIIHTVAGGGSGSGNEVPATSIFLNFPSGIWVDRAGNIFFSEMSTHVVRKVDASTGILTTIAGNGTGAYSGDGGPATSASLNRPVDVFVDDAGNVFIADQNNRRIRKVDSSGIITTVAGDGNSGSFINPGDGNLATDAQLSTVQSVFADSDENLYISDSSHRRIRFVDAQTGIISTVAGGGPFGYVGDGGPATEASFNSPDEVFVAANGDFYIADGASHVIRKVTATDNFQSRLVSKQQIDRDKLLLKLK